MQESALTKDLAALRRKAAVKLKGEAGRLKKLSSWEEKRLVHELGTYQIELEMQNEELRGALCQLETSRRKYADLYDFAPVGYFSFDEKGVVVEVNLTGAMMLGVERGRLLKKPLSLFLDTASQEAFRKHLNEVWGVHTARTCELKMRKKDRSAFFAGLQSVSAEDDPALCRSVMTDITEAKSTRAEMRKAKEELEVHVLERTEELAAANHALEGELSDRRRIEEELRAALAKVKTLTGLLPICFSCKRIRDDKGYWTQIESYIKAHSDADFSHGLCPDCVGKLYPEYAERMREIDQQEKNGKSTDK